MARCWATILVLTGIVASPCAATETGSSTAYARKIYLIRHGAYVPDPKADPELGPGLTPLGIAQARLLAARLVALPVHFDSATSSTMTRAKETADVIRQSFPDIPVQRSGSLSECTPPAFRTAEDQTPQAQATCAKRLDSVFAERFKSATGAERNELIVAHGNVIRYLITKALGVDTRSWLTMSVAHASVSVIRINPDGSFKVLSVGDIGHIPPNLQSWGTDSDPQLVVHTH